MPDFDAPIFRTVYYKELLLLFQPLMNGFTLQSVVDMHAAAYYNILSIFR